MILKLNDQNLLLPPYSIGRQEELRIEIKAFGEGGS